MVHCFDLPALRRVSAGALQLPLSDASRALEGFPGLSDSLSRGPGRLVDVVHDLVGREGFRHRHMAVFPARPDAVPVVDDGEQLAVSELQDAGFASYPDLYEDAGDNPVPGQHPDFQGEDSGVRAAGFFHSLPGLRVYSAAYFAQDASRD